MKIFFMCITALFLWVGVSYGQNLDLGTYQPVFVKDKKEHPPKEIEQSMTHYGRWIRVPEAGYAWRPSEVPPGWNPVKEGHKVWNPAVKGWVWESEQRPWGWLPYEYGHWQLYRQTGWVWVPNQSFIRITPDGISFQIEIGTASPPPPPVYDPEEEHYPRGHAYGHYKKKHKHDEDEDDDDD